MLGWSVGPSLRTGLPWKLLDGQDSGRLGTTSQWMTFNAVVMKRPSYSVDISQNVLGVGLMMLQELSVQVTPGYSLLELETHFYRNNKFLSQRTPN